MEQIVSFAEALTQKLENTIGKSRAIRLVEALGGSVGPSGDVLL